MYTAAAKSLQSCPTLCDRIDGSPPGSSVPGILQARTLSGLPLPSPHMYTTVCKTASWKLLCDTESSAQCSGMSYRHEVGGREVKEGGHVCILTAYSLPCTTECS